MPENYRRINILCTIFKLTIKIITNKICERISLADEQRGSRSGRSCTDAISVIRQVTEELIDCNRPSFMCFIHLQKA